MKDEFSLLVCVSIHAGDKLPIYTAQQGERENNSQTDKEEEFRVEHHPSIQFLWRI